MGISCNMLSVAKGQPRLLQVPLASQIHRYSACGTVSRPNEEVAFAEPISVFLVSQWLSTPSYLLYYRTWSSPAARNYYHPQPVSV